MTNLPDRLDLPPAEPEDYLCIFEEETGVESAGALVERVRRDPASARQAAWLLFTDSLLEELLVRSQAEAETTSMPAVLSSRTSRRLPAVDAEVSTARISRVLPAVPQSPAARWAGSLSVAGLVAASILLVVGFVLLRGRAGDPAVERRLQETNRIRQEYVGQWLKESVQPRSAETAAPAAAREQDRFPTTLARRPEPAPAPASTAPRPKPAATPAPPPAPAPAPAAAGPSAPPPGNEPGPLPASVSPAAGLGTRSSVVVARAENVNGDVYALTDQGAAPVVAGQKLLSGQQIQTGSGESRASIVYADGTRVELGAVSGVAILDPHLLQAPLPARFGKGLFLFEGRLTAEVAKQPPDRPMVLVTSHTTVDVLGTTVSLGETPGGTRVEVLKGLVRATRRADQATALVGAGQFALAASNVPLEAKPLLTDRLLLHLRLDEETGNAAYDASGNGLSVRRVGGKWRPRDGRFAGAIDLDGRHDFLWCSDFPKPASQMTCMAWVYARSRANWGTILKNWSESASRGLIHLGLQQNDGDLECGFREADGGEIRLREGKGRLFPVNAWQHVAAVADGTRLWLYRNGAVVASADYDGTLNGAFAPLGIGVKPGDEGALVPAGTPGYWDGLIDEVRLYGRALSRAEIRAFADEAR